MLVKLEEYKTAHTTHPQYILFTGEILPETGKSWCPDCVAALPLIYDVLKDAHRDGFAILEVDVNRSEYRQQSYVFRKDPRFKIRCVPQLCKWQDGAVVGFLDDSQCQNKHAVAELTEI